MDRRRFVAGVGTSLALARAAEAAPDWDGYPRVQHGPMLGHAEPDAVTVWFRVSGPFATAVEYADASGPPGWRRTPIVQARREDAYMVRHRIAGLRAGADILYRLVVEDAVDPDTARNEPFRARTAPTGPAAFRIAFGSCARRQRQPVQPIWDALERVGPDLFFWLGDNIYGDSLIPEMLLEEYLRQRDIPNCRAFMARRPQLAIWDDHDYGLNDHDRRNPIRAEALGVFNQVWSNPSAGLPGTPGVFFKYAYGGADFFFLDNRYHRDPAEATDGPAKTALGRQQLDWLKSELKASQAPFKLLICGMPWNDGKAPGGESWASFTHERGDLFGFIGREEIAGVVLLSGDTHVGELNGFPAETYGAGYDLFELVSSPLAQECANSYLNYRPIPRIRQVYAGGSNAGVIDLDLSADDPTLRFNLLDTHGTYVWSPFELRASDLTPGRSVWRAKMDRASEERWARASSGGAYYDAPSKP